MRLVINFTDEEHEAIKSAAVQDKRSKSSFVRKAVCTYIGEKESTDERA